MSEWDVLLARQRKASQELPSVEELQLAWTWCKTTTEANLKLLRFLKELLDCLCHDIGLLALQWHRRKG